MMELTTQQLLLAAFGVALSLVTTYWKGYATWFYSVKENYRGLLNIGISVVVAGIVFGLGCTNLPVFSWGVSCTEAGAVELFSAWVVLFASNQLTYIATPESPTKLALKAEVK